jgi:hypothetical protein
MNSNSGSRIYFGGKQPTTGSTTEEEEQETSTVEDSTNNEEELSTSDLSKSSSDDDANANDDSDDYDYHPIIQLHRGSGIPSDVQGLVQTLHTIIPSQVCCCPDHAIDTTYLDESIRIIRYTGPKYEGIRDIYIRAC